MKLQKPSWNQCAQDYDISIIFNKYICLTLEFFTIKNLYVYTDGRKMPSNKVKYGSCDSCELYFKQMSS